MLLYEHTAPTIKEYFLVTMGYHLGGLFTHFFGSRQNDYIEMGFHHILAIFLYGGAYICNGWEVGGVIAFLHDIADITSNVTKPVSDIKGGGGAAAILMLMHMVIWGWTRLVMLPYYIYTISQEAPQEMGNLCAGVFCWLLSCMCLLHFYWYTLFIRIIYKYVTEGKAEDIQEVNVSDKKLTKQE